ncbi:CUE domain-containing protein [Ochrobactrum chromiisoli]|uniref:CUE domain-containing protein n=1 Tax=Ochrobactrum chromiisoli TaxID=2993941 RepID=A0ABT3QMC0_9HYPH|nr:CUE domain-containing protein [Ochrobactrum chromiisoli]MCX2696751.1 CUE domain-containing protein [Ochrobactrum chromiisoli]
MNTLVQNYEHEIEMVLTYHGGDVRAAIEALLKDRDFLAREVELSHLALTHGQRGVIFKRAA